MSTACFRNYTFILLLLLFSIRVVGQTTTPWKKGCTEEYFKVMSYYQKYVAPKSYFKYNNYSIKDGEKSDNSVTEFWRNGAKFKCKNNMMSAFQDDKTTIVISHGRKVIFIRDFDPKAAEDPSAFMQKLINKVPEDSLKKMYSQIICGQEEGKKFIDLKFNKAYFQAMGMKGIKIYYNDKTQTFTKGLYEIYTKDSEGSRMDVYDYIAFSEQFEESVLEGSAINNVMTGQKLLPQYSGYNLKDFRNKK